ncbi:hypothetical protein FRC09_013503 [Ceratobasidium sp. 395]|nr:hypothetical protein FRC09_013503 [Ceratobasidium sp. 395]
MGVPLSRYDHTLIGYGSYDTIPFAYYVNEGQEFDIGIIKLFVTTSPVNFGLLEQESPFDGVWGGHEREGFFNPELASVEYWDTQCMVMILRPVLTRPKPSLEVSSLMYPKSYRF